MQLFQRSALRQVRQNQFAFFLLNTFRINLVASLIVFTSQIVFFSMNSQAQDNPQAADVQLEVIFDSSAVRIANINEERPEITVLSIEADKIDVEQAPEDASTNLNPQDVPQNVESEALVKKSTKESNVDEQLKDIDVLIDMRHAHDFSDYPLTVDDRLYHRIYSYHRAFAYLKSQGVRVEKYESPAPLDEKILARCKTIFLNLPSGDKAPFLLSELIAIKNFVASGGGIFFIVDHTNCYFHQTHLVPLFYELDIEPQFYGICDTTQNVGDGYGWIYLNRFESSPVVQNLREIAFQTGGGVDPRYAVVWSSEKSWKDYPRVPIYGEADVAFYGNFTRDADEQLGRSGCVLAKNFQKGKIVVVGDQNIFSAFFLQYLDNYRLWINSFAWLLDRPELADPQTYIAQAKSDRLLLCWEELKGNSKRFGNPDAQGYYNVYAHICRYFNVFCVNHDDSELGLTADVAVIVGGDSEFSTEGIEFATRQIQNAKTLLVIDAPQNVLQDVNSGIYKIVCQLKENGVVANYQEPVPPQTTLSTRAVEEIAFSNGGKIIVVRGKESYNNTVVPTPEAKLLLTQQEILKTLVRILESALSFSNPTDSDNKTMP